VPCRWCGKSFEEHRSKAHPRAQPRMPCLGLRSGYLERCITASEDDNRLRAATPVFDDEEPRPLEPPERKP
jgi:hypothetical protein